MSEFVLILKMNNKPTNQEVITIIEPEEVAEVTDSPVSTPLINKTTPIVRKTFDTIANTLTNNTKANNNLIASESNACIKSLLISRGVCCEITTICIIALSCWLIIILIASTYHFKKAQLPSLLKKIYNTTTISSNEETYP